MQMHGLLQQLILRSWKREPLRALATIFGVALGLAVIVAIELTKRTSISSFRDSLAEMSGAATLEIRGPVGIPENLLPELYRLSSLGSLSPVIEADAYSDVWKDQLRVLGVDMLRDGEIRTYQLVEFAQGQHQPSPSEFLDLLAEPDSVIISQKLAERRQLKVGSRFTVVFGDKPVELNVRGLLQPRGIAKAMDGNVLIMDLAAVQWHSDKLGRIDRLELKPHSDQTDLTVLESTLAKMLPSGLEAGRPARRGSEVEKMLAAYHFNLTLLAAIAFLAGLCVLYNSISLSVIARRNEVGMLRTLGCSASTIKRLFLAESMVFGLVGGGLGMWLGQAMAKATLAIQQTTTQSLYGQMPAAPPQLEPAFLLTVSCVGMLMALAAAWWPAREASQVSPLQAILPTASHGQPANKLRRTAAATLAAATLGACYLPPMGGNPWGGVLACFTGVLVLGLLLPDLLLLILNTAAKLTKNRPGPIWQLGISGLKAGRHRLGMPLAALSGTLALSAAIAIMVSSFRATLNYWISTSLAADLFFRPASKLSGATDSALSPQTLEILKSQPETVTTELVRLMDLPFRGTRVSLSISDFQVLAQTRTISLMGLGNTDSQSKEILRQAATAQSAASDGPGITLASEPFFRRHGLKAGDTFSLPTPSGPQPVRITALFHDYSNDRGTLMLDQKWYERHFGSFQPTNASLYLKPGTDHDTVATRLRENFAQTGRAVEVFTNAGLRREILRIFDGTFAITWTLELIALLVAMASVATTIFTLVLERRDELQTLKQIGASAPQLRRAFAVEGFLLGIVSQIGGLLLGILLSLVLIYVINVQSFGWTIQFHPPWALLAGSAVLAPPATALAAWLTARVLQR